MPDTDGRRGVGGERKLPAQFNFENHHSIDFLYILQIVCI